MKQASPSLCGETFHEDRIFVAVVKSADLLLQPVEQLMKSHGLTSAQYNVLRILRGVEPRGMLCRGIAERMISRDPDMTRLLDRMEKRALISRERQQKDRRVIMARITPTGLAALKKLDEPVRELHKRQFGHVSAARLKILAELLNEIIPQEPAPLLAASNGKV